MDILFAVLLLESIGAICAVLLTVANTFFAVKEDEKFVAVRDCLPGANCGGCGYSGCDGYAKALSEFDAWLGEFTKKLGEDDVLIITADHGCDPGDESTDHTREYVPMLIYGGGVKPENLGTLEGFYNVGKLVCDLFFVPYWFANGNERNFTEEIFDLGRRVDVY